MPAVNPTRLNFQIADLLQFFDTPEEFHKKLRDLFSLYANRALRYGERKALQPLIPMYRLPDPVMRQLKVELQTIISTNPDASLTLADKLWTDETFEVRQVAIFLLGQAPVSDPEAILSRLNQWLSPSLDPILKEAVLQTGTQAFQSRFSHHWEAWIESLLTEKDPRWNAIGLMGLRSGLQSAPHQKLPAIFRLVSPMIRDPQPRLINELKRLIETLVEKSPTETAYFLRQAHSISNSPGTVHLIRQCLPMFPQSLQTELQAVLKTK